MLFFIGGAARTGKGILVQRLIEEMRMPYLSLDVLKMGLARSVPEYEIDPDAGPQEVAARLWPLVREMSLNLLVEDMNYVFEGEIAPQPVAELRRAFPSQVQACFLGYTRITPAQKLREIRAYGGHPNDWPRHSTDEELLPILTQQIAWSHYLQAQCALHNFPYLDTSEHFTRALDEVIASLQTQAKPNAS